MRHCKPSAPVLAPTERFAQRSSQPAYQMLPERMPSGGDGGCTRQRQDPSVASETPGILQILRTAAALAANAITSSACFCASSAVLEGELRNCQEEAARGAPTTSVPWCGAGAESGAESTGLIEILGYGIALPFPLDSASLTPTTARGS